MHAIFKLRIVDRIEYALEERAGGEAGGGEVVAGDERGWGDVGFFQQCELFVEPVNAGKRGLRAQSRTKQTSGVARMRFGEESLEHRNARWGLLEQREDTHAPDHRVGFFVADFQSLAAGLDGSANLVGGEQREDRWTFRCRAAIVKCDGGKGKARGDGLAGGNLWEKGTEFAVREEGP